MEKHKGLSVKTLLIIIVILSTVLLAMYYVADNNLVVGTNHSYKVKNVGDAIKDVGYTFEVPLLLEDKSEIEVDSLSGYVHIINDAGEVLIMEKNEGNIDYFEYTDNKEDVIEKIQMEDTEKFKYINVRKIYSSNCITTISYNGEEAIYAVVVLGDVDEEYIRKNILNIGE